MNISILYKYNAVETEGQGDIVFVFCKCKFHINKHVQLLNISIASVRILVKFFIHVQLDMVVVDGLIEQRARITTALCKGMSIIQSLKIR